MTWDGRPLLAELVEAVDRGTPVALATVVTTSRSVPRHAGAKMLVYSDGHQQGTIGGGEMESRVIAEAVAALADGRPRMLEYRLVDPGAGDPGVCGGDVSIYLEPYLPSPTIYVVGCGHIGRAVVDLAHWLGFRVVATDDRADLVTSELLPHADVLAPGPITEALASAPATTNTDVVLVTRNAAVDVEILPHLVKTPARSIGVMGSRRRWDTTRRQLAQRGVTDDELARIRTPIGLELNAETPEEIALSILAEIVMMRRQGTGERMGR